MWFKYNQRIQSYEKKLSSNEELLLWYFEKYKESPEYIEAEKQKQGTSSQPNNQAQNKKKKEVRQNYKSPPSIHLQHFLEMIFLRDLFNKAC